MNHARTILCASVLAAAWVALPSLGQAQCTYTSPSTPLSDLRGDYMGQSGGLYGAGSNTPASALFTEGRSRALGLAPIDGAIVMISVGMSNTTQEFSTFVPRAMRHPDINPALVIVDGAQGSEPAPAWTDPGAPTWREVDRRLARAGVRAEQVQVAWIKQAVPNPRGGFPAHAQALQDDLEDIARALRTNYPNIQLAFFSSRTRACTDRGLNPEPYAYESAFSVRWMIDAQQAGERALDPGTRAPLLAWGPYLWAQATPRDDGFAWPCTSVRTDDCTHPADSGKALVADLLLSFFTTDPLAAPWFLRPGAAPPVDAGMPPADGGMMADAAAPRDGGIPDVDAGEPPRNDAGMPVDAGSPGPDGASPPPSSGEGSGGCAVADSGSGAGPDAAAPLLSLVALVILFRRRRRDER